MSESNSRTIKIGADVLVRSRKELAESLKKIKEEGVKRVGIDLSDIPVMDSEAIGMIAYNYVILHDFGGELFIVNPSERVEKVLESTGLSKIIKIEHKPV
jgi:anti-anti-sigma factor